MVMASGSSSGTATAELVAALLQTVTRKAMLPWPLSEADQLLLPQSSTSASASATTTGRRRGSTGIALPPGPRYDVALQLASDPLRFLENVNSQYGSVSGFRLLSRSVVHVSSPLYAREVFVNQSNIFVKEGTAFFPNSSLAGNGLLVSDGELWKRQRRLSNPAFRKDAVETYADAMVGKTREMVETKWCCGGIRDVYADFNGLTTEIVAASLFGGASGSSVTMAEVGPAITTAFEFFIRRATSMFMVPEWVPTPENIQYLSSVRRLDEIVYKLIAERRKRLAPVEAGSIPRSSTLNKDLLSRLLEARDEEDGSGMDDRSLRDELMTFLVAGQETSAILLTWALVMLALHPQAQRRLYIECLEVLGSRTPTHADASKLRYVEAFIWETMRLMPPAYIVGRCACQDTTLGDWNVPAGTTVLVSPYLLHRDPACWPRASEFDPERWLPGGSATRHIDNDSYWPFGGGPRNCIGMGFAMMEVTLVLATLARQYRVSLPPGALVPKPRAMITLRPEDKVALLLSKRTQKAHIRKSASQIWPASGLGVT